MSDRQPADYAFQTLIALIIVFGLFMLTSASSVVAYDRFGDSYWFVKRQLFSFIVGAGLLLVFSRYDYRKLKHLAFLALLVSVGLLIAVLVPGIGVSLLGAKRWISLGPVLFQPSELVKLSMLIYLATWLDRRRLGGVEGGMHLRTFLILLAVTGGLILLQPDLGTLLVILAIAVAVYFTSGAPSRQLVTIFAVGILAMVLAIVVAPYRFQRLTTFFNPDVDPQGESYHITQSLIAIGSGGVTGVGLGHSRQKFNYLPEASGDSIFAVIAEEMGLIVVAGLIALYVAVIIRGYRIAQRTVDPFGKTLAVGITTWIAAQTFLNVGALSGIVPLTGLPLPFISYGGSSLIVLMSAIGILLNVSRSARLAYGRDQR
ncbi:MAG: putative lipid II flippase FtsW [Candidatus Kerfeldbacteria bacterium]|nr:putative lipid II flippase FtsW [Candidatus Kerfeldbacteria bacterium]